MDQLAAHLDRGWDLAQKGDATGASTCARRALELDPKSPEVYNLLGYAAALGGDTEEALEHYRSAIALDETYLEAMLNAAEVLVSPRGEWDEAIELCDDALDYAETTEEIADCVLLKVDALLGKGATDEARKMLAKIPVGPYENPSYDYLVGRAYYEVGQPDKAAPLIEDAVKRTRCTPTRATTSGSCATSGATARGRPTRSLPRALSTCRSPRPPGPRRPRPSG